MRGTWISRVMRAEVCVNFYGCVDSAYGSADVAVAQLIVPRCWILFYKSANLFYYPEKRSNVIWSFDITTRFWHQAIDRLEWKFKELRLSKIVPFNHRYCQYSIWRRRLKTSKTLIAGTSLNCDMKIDRFLLSKSPRLNIVPRCDGSTYDPPIGEHRRFYHAHTVKINSDVGKLDRLC